MVKLLVNSLEKFLLINTKDFTKILQSFGFIDKEIQQINQLLNEKVLSNNKKDLYKYDCDYFIQENTEKLQNPMPSTKQWKGNAKDSKVFVVVGITFLNNFDVSPNKILTLYIYDCMYLI